MHLSLVLSAFIAVQSALSLVCVALPVPPKLPEHRKNAKEHPNAYHFNGLGPDGKLTTKATVTVKKLKKTERLPYGEKMLGSKNPIHADHVFEKQMLKYHLRQHKIQSNHMDSGLKQKLQGILDSKKNMALIPGSVNSSKGQLIKHGMRGKKIKPQPVRDEYALASYRTAHKTAKKLDKALKEHPGYSAAVGDNTLRKKLHNTFVSAGLPPGSQKSSKHSSSSSSGSSSKSSSGSSSGSSSSSQGHSKSKKSKKSTPRPSTPGLSKQSNPGPSTPSPSRRQTKKRQMTPKSSPETQKKKKRGS